MIDGGDVLGWQASETHCPFCGYEYVTVVPVATPFEECPNCHRMHSTPFWKVADDSEPLDNAE